MLFGLSINEWLDLTGLFLFLAGFVIGLGAVVVIDIHGFLGRYSAYWTKATIRTHKITKPLIWVGTSLAIVGGVLFYRNEPFVGIPVAHAVIAGLMLINGYFLSFVVSPFLLKREAEGKDEEILPASFQKKIAGSLLLSDALWWTALILLVWFLLQG